MWLTREVTKMTSNEDTPNVVKVPDSLPVAVRKLEGMRDVFRACLVSLIGEETTKEYEACRDARLAEATEKLYGPAETATSSETPGTVSWLANGAVKAAKALTLPETEESKARLAICQSCDQWTGRSCKLCGCFVKLKVKIPEEKCPAGKW